MLHKIGQETDEVVEYMPEPYVRQELSSAYHFFLSGTIRQDSNTTALIKKLKSCGPQDIISIDINTPGGEMYTMMQIINSIRSCSGRVACHADGFVASAASCIFFLWGHAYSF